ncbi:MAG: TMEM14 family protein [Cyanobacteria bacterium J06621_8]
MNLITILATIAYGLLAGLGGIWGYIKTKSKPSLISGSVSGVLLLMSSILQIQGADIGLLMSRILVFLLLAVFGIRLVKTKKFMPSGVMLIAGALALSCLFAPYILS